MKKYAKYYSAACGLLVTLFFSQTALAYDFKVFAGSECEASDPAADMKYDVGGIYNATNVTQRIVCPVVRDRTHNVGDPNVVNLAWIRVAATVTIECSFHNTDEAGATLNFAAVNSGANVYGPWVLLNPLTNHTGLSLRCTLPPWEGLTIYETAEPDSTDDGF